MRLLMLAFDVLLDLRFGIAGDLKHVNSIILAL
jgi:hypothetical protein